MEAEPLTTEAIALTEKKMDMTLDDIIKMSKNDSYKVKNGKQRVSNKSHKFYNNGAHDKSDKFKRFMETKSSLRQGNLAKRRSSIHDNQFPWITQAARRAAVAPIRSRGFNRSRVAAPRVHSNFTSKVGFFVKQQAQYKLKPITKQKLQTLDSLFANMQEQRMKTLSLSQQHTYAARRNGSDGKSIVPPPWARGYFEN
ncbi:unnamed protein product [Cuscuta campestris]|uniref:Uncharacterized protein n=2 Tax=Cuscuta sect. Cleistogrammica TaxID=1824901 RepID=A0A484K5E6_9ASTE|nr:hypothetical protein DM860_002216 [Cuscuta australis]VFQ59755.1 unnamed protein product [Cuscuta campestris]